MYQTSAARYRQLDAASASPGQLVVMLYDHLLLHLAKARLASAPEHLTARSDALEVCRNVVTELLVTLDRQRGGDIAGQLASIYSYLLGELSTLGVRPDAPRLERIVGLCQQLRDAFATIVAGNPSPAANTASVS